MATYMSTNNPNLRLELINGVIYSIELYDEHTPFSTQLQFHPQHPDKFYLGVAPNVSSLMKHFIYLGGGDNPSPDVIAETNDFHKAVTIPSQLHWSSDSNTCYYHQKEFGIPTLVLAERREAGFHMRFAHQNEGMGFVKFADSLMLDEAMDQVSNATSWEERNKILMNRYRIQTERIDSYENYVPTLHDKIYDQDLPFDLSEMYDTWWESCRDIMLHDNYRHHIKAHNTQLWMSMAERRARQKPGHVIPCGRGSYRICDWICIEGILFTIFPNTKVYGTPFSYTLFLETKINGIWGRIDVFELKEYAINYAKDFVRKYQN